MPSFTDEHFDHSNSNRFGLDDAYLQRGFNETTSDSYYAYSWTGVIRATLAILLRVGYLLMQVGCVPVNNVNLILLQNVVDICCVTVVYFLVGFVVAFDGDTAGLIGGGRWIGHTQVDKEQSVIGWQAAIISSAICTTAIAGRTHTIAYVVASVLIAGLVQPLLLHWAWTSEGWMVEGHLNGSKVFYRDYAGSGIVHVVGGLAGLIGCMTLGRRILRLRDIDEASVAVGSSGTTFAGQLLVFVGLQGLCMPQFVDAKSTITGKYLTHAFINNMLAASSCSLFVAVLHFAFSREAFNHWIVMRCLQGVVSGLVIVSAGADVYAPSMAIGLGCVGGAVFFLVSRAIFYSALEDYCNVIATHFTCALLGSVLVPICVIPAGIDIARILTNLSWQLICLIAVMSLVTIVVTPAFVLLEICGVFRNRSEHLNHMRAMVVLSKGPRKSFMQRLFVPNEDTPYLHPGSVLHSRIRESVDSPLFNCQNQNMEVQGNVDEKEASEIREIVCARTIENSSDERKKMEQTSGTRVKKLRHVHTLPGYSPVPISERYADDETYEIPITESGKKHSSEMNLKDTKTLYSKTENVFIGTMVQNVLDLKGDVSGTAVSDVKVDTCSSDVTLKDEKKGNEETYRLRRTPKFMNLHKELDKRTAKFNVTN